METVHDVTSTPTVIPQRFEDFYKAYRPQLARALVLALGDRELGIEAADEAMVRTYQQWRRVRTYRNPMWWVYRVGVNWDAPISAGPSGRSLSTPRTTRRRTAPGAPDVTLLMKDLSTGDEWPNHVSVTADADSGGWCWSGMIPTQMEPTLGPNAGRTHPIESGIELTRVPVSGPATTTDPAG